jgi:hypothetical protein
VSWKAAGAITRFQREDGRGESAMGFNVGRLRNADGEASQWR